MLLKVGIKPEDMIEEIKTGIKRNNIGQKVERELIKRLQITAPYLIPMVIR